MTLQQLQADPAKFRAALKIEADSGLVSLNEVLDDWQRRDFEATDPAWTAVVHRRDVPGARFRSWCERPRGHSKTTDLATSVVWALFAARYPIRGVCAAADVDQGKILIDSISRTVRANGWLSGVLDVQAAKVLNRHTGGEVSVISSDSPSSFGLLVDFVAMDELTNWAGRELFDSLLSASAKKRRCVVSCILNSGFDESWQHEVREAIRADGAWYFSHLDGPCASWISEKLLAEQRRLLPPVTFDRLWLNRWTSGAGDALELHDIEAAIRSVPDEREVFVGGLDVGLKHDHSVLVVLGKRKDGVCRVAKVRRWRPNGGTVDLDAVEREISADHRKFRFQRVAADPWQSSHLVHRLRKSGMSIVERHQSGRALVEQAMALVGGFKERSVVIPDNGDLIRELKRLRIEERSYGIKLTSPRDEHGHGDAVSALSIALVAAKEAKVARFTASEFGHFLKWRDSPEFEQSSHHLRALMDSGDPEAVQRFFQERSIPHAKSNKANR